MKTDLQARFKTLDTFVFRTGLLVAKGEFILSNRSAIYKLQSAIDDIYHHLDEMTALNHNRDDRKGYFFVQVLRKGIEELQNETKSRGDVGAMILDAVKSQDDFSRYQKTQEQASRLRQALEMSANQSILDVLNGIDEITK